MPAREQLDWVGDIPDPPAPFAKTSDTSRAAAESLTNTQTLRACVYHALRMRGEHGATDQELQELLHLPPNVETPRRWELVNAGLVHDSGRRRLTRAKRNAAVWIANRLTRPAA